MGMRRGIHQRPMGALLTVAALAALIPAGTALHFMRLEYTWGNFNYAFDNDQQRQEVTSRSNFAAQNTTPFDVDVDPPSGRIFLASPGILPGLQPTLATIKQRNRRDSPEIEPYPDWSWYTGQGSCDKPISVFRIYIDNCRRLWAIDSGVVDIGNSFQRLCPPKLFVFDLKTDELIVTHTFQVPSDFESSLLLNVIAEQRGWCCNDDAYAYIADSGSFALYVYSLESNESWRVESDTFSADPAAIDFSIDGSNFTVEDGILGLAQSERYLYYHAFASFREGKVLKSVLRNKSLFVDNTNQAPDEFRYIGRRETQSAGQALASNHVMFFSQVTKNSIYCWDTSTPYTSDNHLVVEHDDRLFNFVTGMKVIRWSPGNEEVWAIDNNGQRLFAGEFEPNQPYTVNIIRGSASVLSAKCKRRWRFPFYWGYGK